MKHLLLGCLISLLLAGCGGTFRPSAGSRTGTIIGTLTDAATGEPVAGAAVIIENSRFGTLSDDNGTFVIEHLPVGEYRVAIRTIDYQKIGADTVLVQTGRATKVDRRLLKKESALTDAMPADGTGIIEGYVSDSATGGPLYNVAILLIGTKLGAMSDSSGAFRVRSVPPGQYSLRLSGVGFRVITVDSVIVQAGRSVRISRRMAESYVEM